MKVEIVITGPYSDFDSDPPCRAVIRRAGDVIDYPDWYARGLVDAGLASAVEDIATVPKQVKSANAAGRRRRRR